MVNTDEILPSLHPTTSCSGSTRWLRKCCLQRHTKHPEVKSNLVIVVVKRSSPFHSKILYIIYIFFFKKIKSEIDISWNGRKRCWFDSPGQNKSPGFTGEIKHKPCKAHPALACRDLVRKRSPLALRGLSPHHSTYLVFSPGRLRLSSSYSWGYISGRIIACNVGEWRARGKAPS